MNTGSGWQNAPQYLFPNGSGITDHDAGRDKGVRFVDLNGDGLADAVISYNWDDDVNHEENRGAYLNTGNGWQEFPDFKVPFPISTTGQDNGARFLDLNGDGLADYIWKRDLTGAGSANFNTGTK